MIRNLVWEGGGVKGIAYGGALIALEERGLLDNVERVAGTSAGAITAVLLACGYSAEELSKIVAETDFNNFADDSFGVARDIDRLIDDYGWHKGNYFTGWIGDLIQRKFGRAALTFQQLKDMGGTLDLYLTATNLSKQRVEIFSQEHTPDTKVMEAARMSMGIPLYFQCVRFGPDQDIMVDGGVSYNYPVDIFDDTKYLSEPGFGKVVDYDTAPGHIFNQETLGFRVDSANEIALSESWSSAPKEIGNFFDFTEALIEFSQNQANKRHLHANDWNRTVFIDSGGVQATDFDLTEGQVSFLIDSGKAGVESFFSKKRFA